MKPLLVPDRFYTSLLDVDFHALESRTHLILDIDNTLLGTFESAVDPAVVTLFNTLREEGVITGICLVSNVGIATSRRTERVKRLASDLRAEYVFAYGWHVKPHPRPFLRAMDKMYATPEKTVVIGDQIFTDIRGGNELGMYTILVKPIGRDRWVTWYRRWLERRLPPL